MAETAGEPAEAAALWQTVLRLDPKRRRAREEIGRLNRLAVHRWVHEGERRWRQAGRKRR